MRALCFAGKRALFPLLLTLSLWPLFAREVQIVVEDTDLGLPLEGAVIRSWDGTEYVCDETGGAVVSVPGDRQVVIQAAYPGYENGRLVIPLTGGRFSLGLRLSGVMEGRELVIEASRPEVSETKSGRSVAISGEALNRTAEIGIIEDVMNSVKLLPGVGYAGMTPPRPSPRGGAPGDLTAALDGFYVESPYHWGGGFSIFDPRMVESARLSHGVFSTRYGHTISGLLEITSRRGDPRETELELGLSSSAANLNLSFPLGGRGAVLVMGKVTYYDPFVWAAQALLGDTMPEINAVTTAPYIRSTALSANYRFSPDLEWRLSGFLGSDGVGVKYQNDSDEAGLQSSTSMEFHWVNTQGFALSALTWNPRPPMVLKTSLGSGFLSGDLYGDISNDLSASYTDAFKIRYGSLFSQLYPGITPPTGYTIEGRKTRVESLQGSWNIQGRADFDWDLGEGLLLALGVQEFYSRWGLDQYVEAYLERKTDYLVKGPPNSPSNIPLGPNDEFYMGIPFNVPRYDPENGGFTSSAYTLLEYASPDKKFGAEAGLRLDHFFMKGTDFTLRSRPPYDYRSLSPRVNLDYTLLRNRGFLSSLDITLGTGLFSSLNGNVPYYQGTEDREIPFNRSWTSLAGLKTELAGGWVFNIEGYYKKVFDRTYVRSYVPENANRAVTEYRADGEGHIWGFDFMLQKLEGRWWDGWLSYSFNHALYRGEKESPDNSDANRGIWYFPSFHRFHTLNLVMNIKPRRNFNIALRAGLASGQPKPKVGTPQPYPVQLYEVDNNGNLVPQWDAAGNPVIVERWKRGSEYSPEDRVDWSIPLDLKLSWFVSRGKSLSEFYLAFENLSSLFYKVRGNTTFNSYTGKEDAGSDAAVYELPIPMISLGFKWSY
jgi:hypothetical protein